MEYEGDEFSDLVPNLCAAVYVIIPGESDAIELTNCTLLVSTSGNG